ncbi:MAG: TolC family protein [Candidatus Riflebacteria bacterium]|nr:TolC family protein [Candidatus Riflebacteria bacterium]
MLISHRFTLMNTDARHNPRLSGLISDFSWSSLHLFRRILLIVLLLSPVAGWCNEPPVAASPMPDPAVLTATSTASSTLIFGVASGGQTLSLQECVRLGVATNLRLSMKDLELEERRQGITVAKRIFVPQATLQTGVTGPGNRFLTDNAAISRKTGNGSSVGVRVEGSRALDDAGGDGQAVSAFLSRPLLRGFGRRITGIEIDQARLDEETAMEAFKAELNSFIRDLSEQYFSLYFAQLNCQIQEEAWRRAHQQYDDIRHDINRGALPEQDIYVVEENMVNFEINRANARRDISAAQLAIRRLLCWDPASMAILIASDSLSPGKSEVASAQTLLKQMNDENPTLRIARLAERKSRLDLDAARDLLRPLLDLQVNWGVTRGSQFTHDSSWNAGLRFETPLSLTGERAGAERSRLVLRQNELSSRDLKISLGYDLETVLLDLEHQGNVYLAKQKATSLARKKLDAEIEKYKNGLTTLNDVVLFQRELENALIDETGTLVSLERLRIARGFLDGSLWRRFGIEIGS